MLKHMFSNSCLKSLNLSKAMILSIRSMKRSHLIKTTERQSSQSSFQTSTSTLCIKRVHQQSATSQSAAGTMALRTTSTQTPPWLRDGETTTVTALIELSRACLISSVVTKMSFKLNSSLGQETTQLITFGTIRTRR